MFRKWPSLTTSTELAPQLKCDWKKKDFFFFFNALDKKFSASLCLIYFWGRNLWCPFTHSYSPPPPPKTFETYLPWRGDLIWSRDLHDWFHRVCKARGRFSRPGFLSEQIRLFLLINWMRMERLFSYPFDWPKRNFSRIASFRFNLSEFKDFLAPGHVTNAWFWLISCQT